MYATLWSLLPFLIIIPMSLITKQLLPGLFVGLIIGAYMLHPTPLGGIETALQYILKELAAPDNLRLLVFMYFFGSFIGLVRITGGVSGFSRLIEEKISSSRNAFIITWLSALFTFMAPSFRIITIGPVMKEVFQRLKVPVDKVAFIIESTATPLCAILPLGTVFIGYALGLLSTVSRHQEVITSPFNLFLLSIPFNLFSIVMLVFALFYTFRNSDKKPIIGQSPKACSTAKIHLNLKKFTQDQTDVYPDPVEIVSQHVASKPLNLIVPLTLLLGFTLFYTWWDGHLLSAGFLGAIIHADAARAMLIALLSTLILTFVWFFFRKQPIQRTLFGFLQGGNEMMSVNILLVLVWAVSAISTDLGFINYIEKTIGHFIPMAFIAPSIFVFGCILSYIIGSTLGTWGILMPLAFSLTSSDYTALPLVTGAVFASGVFGGLVSPLSDNTLVTATVMKIPVMDYAKFKLRYGLMVAAVCTVLYGIAGLFYR